MKTFRVAQVYSSEIILCCRIAGIFFWCVMLSWLVVLLLQLLESFECIIIVLLRTRARRTLLFFMLDGLISSEATSAGAG